MNSCAAPQWTLYFSIYIGTFPQCLFGWDGKKHCQPQGKHKRHDCFHFHLKGNLLSFVSHKTFTTFLLLREISLYSASLTNPDTSAVLWVPGKKAMSKSHDCGLEEGPHQQHSQGLGRKQRSWKEEWQPQFLPHLPANTRKKGKQCPETERLHECNHHLFFPG